MPNPPACCRLPNVSSSQACEPWQPFMLDAVAGTSAWSTAGIGASRRLNEQTSVFVRQRRPRRYRHARVDVVLEQPYCRILNPVGKDIAQRQAALRDLKESAVIGVAQKTSVGKEKSFLHPKRLMLLTRNRDDFSSHIYE